MPDLGFFMSLYTVHSHINCGNTRDFYLPTLSPKQLQPHLPSLATFTVKVLSHYPSSSMLPLPFSQRPAPRYQLASASLPSSAKSANLPLEGTLYDSISLTNFLDVESHALTATIQKTLPSDALSKLLDADLPARVTLSAKAGTIGSDGAKWNPSAKAALSIRLLDLGTSDTRQKGFLKFKMSVRTNGRRDHGFEIDRKVQLFNLPNTTLYGNVAYKTNNKTDEWKTMSSFGLHQDIRVAGFKFAARAGLTPEGDFVYDLKL